MLEGQALMLDQHFFCPGGVMARIPDEEIERLKSQISLERLAEAKGIKLKRHGREPRRSVPVPRRPRAVAGDHTVQEFVALPGRMPGGRNGDRLGDASGGRALPTRRRALARGSSLFSGVSGEAAREAAREGGEADDDAEAAGAARAERRR